MARRAASARAVATAASMALPPASSTATPASAASRDCETTMPRRPVAAGLVSCQCWVRCGGRVSGIRFLLGATMLDPGSKGDQGCWPSMS